MTVLDYRFDRYKRSRYWAVYDTAGQMICLTVYKKGAQEVIRRLMTLCHNL